MTCTHHYSITQNIITALKIFRDSHIHHPFPCKTLGNNDLFIVYIVVHFLECHMVGIIQCVVFSDWPFSLSNRQLSFFHVLSWLLVLRIFHCLHVFHWLSTNVKNIYYIQKENLRKVTNLKWFKHYLFPQKNHIFCPHFRPACFQLFDLCAVLFILWHHVPCDLTVDKQWEKKGKVMENFRHEVSSC